MLADNRATLHVHICLTQPQPVGVLGVTLWHQAYCLNQCWLPVNWTHNKSSVKSLIKVAFFFSVSMCVDWVNNLAQKGKILALDSQIKIKYAFLTTVYFSMNLSFTCETRRYNVMWYWTKWIVQNNWFYCLFMPALDQVMACSLKLSCHWPSHIAP